MNETQHAATQAWRKVCALVAGTAMGPTVAALESSGALDVLSASPEGVLVEELAARCGLHPGHIHTAFAVLGSRGLTRSSRSGRDARVQLLDAGRRWVPHAHAYLEASGRVSSARGLREAMLESGDPGVLRIDVPTDVPEEVRWHLAGPALGAVVGGMGWLGDAARLFRAPMGFVPAAALRTPPAVLECALPALVDLGWLRREEDLLSLTPEGRSAVPLAPLFNYAHGYLGVYARAEGLLLGQAGTTPGDARDPRDRLFLVRGKEYVFRMNLAPILEEVLRGIVGSDVADRPRVILDLAAAEGGVLEAIDGMLDSFGVRREVELVGLCADAAQAEQARQRLGERARILRGGFSDVAAAGDLLSQAGVDLAETLAISKTTIHDRILSGQIEPDLLPARGRPSEAVFVDPAGERIDPRRMEDELASFFRRWRGLLGRFGLIAIDAHAVPEDVAAATAERNLHTQTVASHGYSAQYLIECDRFREAARRAGFRARVSRDLGSPTVEAPTMSLEHLVPSS